MNKKIITAISMFGVLLVLIVCAGVFGKNLVFEIPSVDTTYEVGDFSFKSDEFMFETKVDGFSIAFENLFGDVAVLGNSEKKSYLLGLGYDEVSLENYANLAHETNENNPSELKKSESEKYYYYTYTAGDEKGKFYYLCVIYESEEDFWLVNFACKEEEKDEYKDKLIEWADSVIIKNN